MLQYICKVKLVLLLLLCSSYAIEAQNGGGLVNIDARISSGKDATWTIHDAGAVSSTFSIISQNNAHTVLGNLKITNSSVQVVIDELSALTVTGTFTNEGGTNSLLLKSTEEGSASLIHQSENLQASIERYIPGVYSWTGEGIDWHFLSSPVTDQPIVAFTTEGVDNGYDFYGWDEAADTWRNFKSEANWNVFNSGFDFNPGQGYMVAYQQTQTFTFSGPVNVSDVIMDELTMSGSGQPGEYGNGWHLLGNPFASALDLDKGSWLLDKMDAQLQLWCADKGGYKSQVIGEAPLGEIEDNIIPPHQGFFVRATEGGASFTIPSEARVHNNRNIYKNENDIEGLPENTLKIFVAGDNNGFYDVGYVRFLNNAGHGFDPEYDAHKLFGLPSRPHILGFVSGVRYSIYSMPPDDGVVEVPLHFFPGADNQFTVHFSGMHDFYPYRGIYLDDLVTGIRTNLLLDDHYSFGAESNYMPGRFVLVFGETDEDVTGIDELPLDAGNDLDISIYSHQKNIYIDIPDYMRGHFYVYTTSGRIIHTERFNYGGEHVIPVRGAAGIYIVRIVSSNRIINRKIPVR